MVELKFIIPDNKLDDFKAGFLKAVPKPEELAGMNDNLFIKGWIKNTILNVYRTGKIKLAQETTTPEVDYDIVEE